MNTIETLFNPKKFKLFIDESFDAETDTEARREKWRYFELRGKYGMIYPYSLTELGVVVTKRGTEKRHIVPLDQFNKWAKEIRVFKRRQVNMTPEQRKAVGNRLFLAKKQRQEALSSPDFESNVKNEGTMHK